MPVAPACHYASGGVRTDLWGRTDVPGLYATGEAACSGVHGANRLASNSLLEGLVFSRRIATVLPGELRRAGPSPPTDERTAGLVAGSVRRELQEVMTAHGGVLRSATGLAEAVDLLDKLAEAPAPVVDQDSWETTNLLTISAALPPRPRAARGDPRLALARGLPRARRRRAGPATSTPGCPTGRSTLAFVPAPAHRHGASRE